MPSKKDSKNKQIAYIVIILLMIISTVFVVLKRVKETQEQRSIVGNFGSVSQEDALAAAGIVDDDSLDTILNSLVRYGDWPVTLREMGRTNPFVPVRAEQPN